MLLDVWRLGMRHDFKVTQAGQSCEESVLSSLSHFSTISFFVIGLHYFWANLNDFLRFGREIDKSKMAYPTIDGGSEESMT